MTITEMISLFDIIQDKVDSPYFTGDEKEQLINSAQDKFLNEVIFQYLFPPKRGGGDLRLSSSLESNLMGSEALEPLFVLDLQLSSDASGIVNRSDIKSAMNVVTGDTTDYLAIMSIAKDLSSYTLPVKFVRSNDFEKFQRNEFKKATDSTPQYRIERDRLKFLPSGVADYLISVVKEPIRVVYDEVTPANNVDCEFPSFTHNTILSLALSEAGVASRDAALTQIKQMSDNNLTTLR